MPNISENSAESREIDVPMVTENADALLVFNILRTQSYISPYLDRNLKDIHITAPQLEVLLLLRDSPEGLPLGEIGRRLVVTKANVTGLIDRLEQKKLVARENTDDRRVTLARLTPDSLHLLDQVLPRHNEQLAEIGDCLSPDEKELAIKLLSKLRDGMRAKGMHKHGPSAQPTVHNQPDHS